MIIPAVVWTWWGCIRVEAETTLEASVIAQVRDDVGLNYKTD